MVIMIIIIMIIAKLNRDRKEKNCKLKLFHDNRLLQSKDQVVHHFWAGDGLRVYVCHLLAHLLRNKY